ncbi:Eco57I restriction-modification methylase domain-containing protein, partial [Emticicia sp. BO119]|uniref:Eco57I restriction-modification methylase domain-containing protein n=1 Tax=Emticicia sp. BO119 TaxID=2757768 RepID=UPI0015F0BA4B
MTYPEQKNLLQQPYSLNNFKQVLDDIFPQSNKYFETHQQLFKDYGRVVEGFQFGNIMLSDGKSIALFDVNVTDNTNIIKNRKGLRDIAVKYIDNGIVNSALVAFHSSNKSDYRLSFIARQSNFTEDGDFVVNETAPKRYTFILGPNESCTTAAKRLTELKEKVATDGLKALIEAFSVEKLNKDFFKGYKEHYERFCRFLNVQPDYRSILIDSEQSTQDKAEKPIRDFAKKLLGRIVFLYFLQKKGWMGVPVTENGWANGNLNFVKKFHQSFLDKSKFYSVGLVNLFFKTLNHERKDDIFELTDTKIPYLNGGLFDNDQPETNHFDFPENYFSELFDFFEQYNFTIDENDPDDANVGIDPEMLGHIFENLLEENKDKGAFYTPKAIVQYLCQESLIQYLQTHLGEESIEEIARLVRYNERGNIKGFIVKNARKIEELLDNVKVCDPAIGSGAFPVAMLNEIFKTKLTLDLTLDPAEVKRHIIQNSIYGVDIDKGAVDIARLRFWLALVVEEDVPSPLPNLDYKIMQGNSLLESFEGIDLRTIHQQKAQLFEPQLDLFGNIVDSQITIFHTDQTENIQSLLEEYFHIENLDKKRSLRKRITEAVHNHIEYNIELREKQLERRISEAGKPANMNTKTRKDYDKLLTDLQKLKNSRQQLHTLQDRTERPYFLWRLFFKDIFDKGGFDIVIGNPPYIQLQNDGGYLAKQFENEEFETFERTGDIYSLFYELGYNILKPNGCLAFITSNKWMRAGYGESLRGFFAHKTDPIILIDFAGQKIFENATVETNILIFLRRPNTGNTKTCTIKKKKSGHINDFFEQNKTINRFHSSDSWVILNPIEQRIKAKIEKIGTPLKDWDIQINYGIKTGFNEAFIIDGKKREELIKLDPKSDEIIRPILRGRDIKKYGNEFADLWLLFIPWHFPLHFNTKISGASEVAEKEFEKQYPAIYKHLLSFKKQLSARNKDETGIRYEWYALQRWGANYWDDFSKQKIIWGEISDKTKFSIDLDGKYLNEATTFLMVG